MVTERFSWSVIFLLITFLFCLNDKCYSAVKNDAGEDFAVTLNVNKSFTSFNYSQVIGTGSSDGQKAISYVNAGPYENGRSRSWAGVLFDVEESPSGTHSFLDAVISITFSYKLKVDFDVLPPSQNGGGSADARIYAWIRNDTDGIIHEKREIDNIVFIHDKNYEEKTGTHTFSHRLSNSPSWTHLHVGKKYEVSIELYTHADVYIGHDAVAYAEVTIEEIKIEFDNPVQPTEGEIFGITEKWELSFDDGQGRGDLTLIERQDETIIADGNWVYTYQGSDVSGVYTNAPVKITGTSIAITASGTATNPSAPPGYKTSPFTLKIIGTALDGKGSGTFTMTFKTVGWPDRIIGSWEGTRTSGSGITAVESKGLPWILLLLKD